jgi:cytochrome P450
MSDASSSTVITERARELPPGPRGLPLLGSAHKLASGSLELISDATRAHGETVMLRFGPIRFVIINRPEDVRHVLVKNHRAYAKSRSYEPLRLLLGNGLVTSEGPLWTRQRKLMQPAFHRQRLAGFAETMVTCTMKHLDRWDAREAAGERELDVHAEMMRLTFVIVGQTLFSVDLSRDACGFGDALTTAIRYASARTESLSQLLPAWLPTPANLRFRRARRVLDRVVARMIAERRASSTTRAADLMAMLMAATDESGTERMSDVQLRDEVMTLVAAGHETTSNLLTWTFLLLAQHPEIERRLHAELTRALGARPPTFTDLDALVYTEQVINESMRLYPPVWMIERAAVSDDQLGDPPCRIPKGTIVGVCPWTLHRNPRLWANPEAFDPERFTPTRAAERPRYAFLPFGAGPRMCIGNGFAMMEAKLLLATILQRYRLELIGGQQITLDPGITLRPARPIRMSLHRRDI